MLRKYRFTQGIPVVAALALSFGLASCSQGSATDTVPTSATASAVSAHLIVTGWRNGDDAMLAQQSGVLIIQPDHCVGLRIPSKSKPVLLRWPEGTTLSEDGKAVVGSSGKHFSFDTEVGFGGGYGLGTIPSECDSSMWSGVFEVQQPL